MCTTIEARQCLLSQAACLIKPLMGMGWGHCPVNGIVVWEDVRDPMTGSEHSRLIQGILWYFCHLKASPLR